MFAVQQKELDYYSCKWQLINLKLLSSSSTSYLLEGYQESSKSKVILKFGLKSEIISEASALKFYNGLGCVRLLAVDEKRGVLLRSYAYLPSLRSFFPNKDEDAVLCAVSVMKKLHSKKPPKDGYPTIADWINSLKTHSVILKNHIDRAKSITRDLLNSSEQNVLLHGDLHHDNLLQNEQGEWIAIDPKGVVGEVAYEVGAFIRNPMPELLKYNASDIINRRIKLFSEHLGIDEERIRKWSYVQSVLAACFAIEDNQSWRPWIKCTELITYSN
ncbi:streptomycin-6-phosphotransferase [Candidatus Phycorickettsia trachydisci]|uniref:Streptomycin-6-phosphotransferase n=1 Tax=Candidatus Phycorickettsia trachydisci TaxID=2115978 RepID=A0A2P1P875_9RICK|nr:aminoglycoside phosphotransferase family protein [Candidatus Phycorickettsia trachydisci]AVP87480.1 streptomycin-6-phosphotransferase [Candidatus Phycorickettsia trachydisci]